MQTMEKRDYLLRQIEALGRILSRLRSLIVGGDTVAADAEIRQEMRNAGLELSTANALDPATLRMLLGGAVMDSRRAFTVGSLLHLDALRARAEGDEAWAARSAAGARALLAAVRPQLDPERAALADELLAGLPKWPTPPAPCSFVLLAGLQDSESRFSFSLQSGDRVVDLGVGDVLDRRRIDASRVRTHDR